MAASGDFLPGEDQLGEVGPTYPTVFGLELTPPAQALAIVLLGVAASFALYNFLVRPVRQQITAANQAVNDVQAQVDQQRASLQEVAVLQAQLDEAIQQRVAIYDLLGTSTTLDTLLIDINQQIQNSNAAIEDVLRSDFDRIDQGQLASLGLNQAQVTQIRSQFAGDPVIQRVLYASELWQFTPSQVVPWTAAPPELQGKINSQTVEVSMQALFPQTLNILRNIERLEPLIIIRNLEQEQAPLRGGLSEEDVQGLTRPLNTTFTLEVLVPAIDPSTPPPPPPPPEAAAGAEGAPPPEGAPPAEGTPPP